MMWRIISIIAVLALMVGNAHEAQAQQAMLSGDAPIEITADSLDVLQEKQVAIFTGNVEAIQGEIRLQADRMTVYYTDGSQPTAAQSVSRISRLDVVGKVRLVSPTETARGDRGIYYVDRRLVRLLGNVVLTRGQNVLKGDGMEYDMASGRSRLVSKPSQAGQNGNGRVKGLFVPNN